MMLVLMLVLLLYSYCSGVFSSRKIAARCETDVALRVIVGETIPDFRNCLLAERQAASLVAGISNGSSSGLSRCCGCVRSRGC